MTRLTLHYELRAMNDPLAKEALAADDAVVFLDRARREAWRSPVIRRRAARILSDHLWPDDDGAQPANWSGHYVRNINEKRARERMGTYDPPTDDDGETLDGYHYGGVWFPEPTIASAGQGECPACGFVGEFWNFEDVDAGDAVEPAHVCGCGWTPSDDDLLTVSV